MSRGYLLDTHVFLWAAQNTRRLSPKVRNILENASSSVYLSSISAYETIYKHGIGKLVEYDYLVSDLAAVADKLSLIELPVRIEHAIMAARLAVENRDPFDRIIAAQAKCAGLTLLSADAKMRSVPGLDLVW